MALDQPIPLITDPPLPSDEEAVYEEKANGALLSWNASVRAANLYLQTLGLSFIATSNTNVEIGGGIKNFVVEPNLFLVRGMPYKATYRADIRKSMRGLVESYNKTTGELVLDVAKAIGNGTYADWDFSIVPDGANENDFGYAVTTGTSTLYELTLDEPIAEYKDGQIFPLKFHTICGTNAKLRVSGLNPPLDIKIQDKYGADVNVFMGDVLDSYNTGMVINGGSAIRFEASIDAEERVGMTYDHTGFEPHLNTFEVPLVATDISRAAYPKLLKKWIKSSAVSLSIANPGVVTWAGHGLANGSPIYLTTTGALPTGHTVNAKRFVVNRTTDTFQLSLTKGGAAIATTGSQSGVHTAHYAPYGNGNGTTTFGCYYLKQDHAEVRGTSGNFGEETAGENKTHLHGGVVTNVTNQGVNYIGAGTPFGIVVGNTASEGGAANLAAGMRVMKLVVYQ